MTKNSRPDYEPAYRELEPVRKTDPLIIPEILIWVLELASPEEKATAARVCRRWFDPALDALWRDLTDIAPFLKMFSVLKSIENPRMSPTEMLERITSYGARVRTLKCTASNSSILDSGTAEVYQALCRGELQQYLPTVPIPSSGLFPNLRTLEWMAEQTQPHVENTLDAVSYFLSPSLKHLHVLGIVEQKDFQVEDWDSFFPGPAIDCAPFFRNLNFIDGLRMESLELQMGGIQRVLTKDDEVEFFLRRHQKSLLHLRTWHSDLASHFQQEMWGLSPLRSLDVVIADKPQAALFIGLADGASEMEDLRLTILSCGESRKWQELWDALKGLRKLTKLRLEIPAIGGWEKEM
ncbi:hypothetical protein FRC00_000749 [Tulasnella sp. 408]|nr:hypothetical protein FRC00_000749 [Tulasnella sp. 408]